MQIQRTRVIVGWLPGERLYETSIITTSFSFRIDLVAMSEAPGYATPGTAMVVYAALLRGIRQTPRRNRYRGLRMQKQALGCSITSLKGESGCQPVSHRIQIRIASDTIGLLGTRKADRSKRCAIHWKSARRSRADRQSWRSAEQNVRCGLGGNSQSVLRSIQADGLHGRAGVPGTKRRRQKS